MTESPPTRFAPALLKGLATLGPVEPFSGDLSLELGLSVWLRRSGTSVLEAREALIGLRRVAAAQGRRVPEVVAQVVAALPEPGDARSEALGA